MKKFIILLIVTFLLVGTISGFALAKKEITVGAKNFTEQYVLGNMIALLLEANGFTVDEKFGTGSAITRGGLTSGQTDLYAEYTGTASLVYLKHEEVITDPVELYNKVKKEDLEKNGIVWLDRSGINNTYAIALTKEQVAEIGTTLSDLAKYVNKNHDLIWGIDHEFAERADGLPGMAEHYGMNIDKENIKTMDAGLTYEALDRGLRPGVGGATEAQQRRHRWPGDLPHGSLRRPPGVQRSWQPGHDHEAPRGGGVTCSTISSCAPMCARTASS